MNRRKANLITWRIVLEPHLLISLLYACLGTEIAFRSGLFSLPLFLIAALGAVSSQIAANTFDEFFDHRFGTDLMTVKTPYSGGGRIIFDGGLTLREAFNIASIALILALISGIYLSIVSGWGLVPLFIFGGVAGTFYSPFWQRNRLGELMLCVIGLIVMGAFFVQAHYYSFEAVYISVPCGILIANLVVMNEVPDAEADKATGRKNVATMLGPENAVNVYLILATVIYAMIVAGALAGLLPLTILISLISSPVIYSAYFYAHGHTRDMKRVVPALRNNIVGMYIFIVLLVVAYMI
ncbi:MAG: prenyltransferase [Methanomassiliicoccales archaeon]